MHTRTLPVYAAGAIDVPVHVFGNDELIDRDTLWSEHSHPTHELLWHEAGAGAVAIGPREWTVAPSVGLWIPAGTLHSGWTPAGTQQRAAHFHTSTPALAQAPSAVEITPLLRLLLDRLITAELSPASHATTQAMILDVLRPSENGLLLHVPAKPLLAPIVEAVRGAPGDATTLAGWAARLDVSARTITRAFGAETGMGFTRWVATARAQHAVVLLAQGMEIDEVAGMVGYRSASAFTTAFRRVTGTTPGRYRTLDST